MFEEEGVPQAVVGAFSVRAARHVPPAFASGGGGCTVYQCRVGVQAVHAALVFQASVLRGGALVLAVSAGGDQGDGEKPKRSRSC